MDTEEAQKITTILIVAFILGVILVYFIISLIRHQRRNIKLNQEKVEAEILALEKERKRIAADLHDEIGPTLSGIKLMLSGFSVSDEAEAQLLSKVNTHIDSTISRMRQISNNLMPRIIEKRSLGEALRSYIEEMLKFYPIKINFQYDEGIDLTDEKKIHIYRIFQEITHNTIKHAQATKLDVLLSKEKNLIILQTKDDGIGFVIRDEVKKSSGLGLRNLVSRSEILGGKIHIETGSGKGTHIILKIPI